MPRFDYTTSASTAAIPQRYISHNHILWALMLTLIAIWSLTILPASAGSPTGNPISKGADPGAPTTEGKGGAPSCDPNWQIDTGPNATVSPGALLEGVDSISSTDVWAVGYSGTPSTEDWIKRTLIQHWDGTAWTIVPSPNRGTGDNELISVAAISANDVWAVGYDGNSRALIMHWNGTAWSLSTGPHISNTYQILMDVTATSANNVWAVGSYDNASGVRQTLALRWNGSTWSVSTTPNQGTTLDNRLEGIDAVAGKSIWAVGSYRNSAGTLRTLIMRWNGLSWSIYSSPNFGSLGNTLFDIDAVSSGDIWAVGRYYSTSSITRNLAMHWNGTSWAIVTTPNSGTSAQINSLTGVAAVSANDVWAVGHYAEGRLHSQAMHWDGVSWSLVGMPDPGVGGDDYTIGITTLSATDAWIVGMYNTTGNEIARTLVTRWSGSLWGIVSSPNPNAATNTLTAVSAPPSGGDVWAVGSFYHALPSMEVHRNAVQRRTGNTWYQIDVANAGNVDSNYLKGVSALSNSQVWIVGYYDVDAHYYTMIQRWNGTTWTPFVGTNVGSGDNVLNGVAAISTNNAWAVGYYKNGTISRTLITHWNGTAWSVVTSPNVGTNNNTLTAISYVSANDIWAVGSYHNGSAIRTLTLHYNGTSWSVVTSPNTNCIDCNNILSGVTAVSSNNAWAVGHSATAFGYRTLILRWNGSVWSLVTSANVGSSHNYLTSISKVSANDIWAVGNYNDSGTTRPLVEHWNGSSWSAVTAPSSGTGNNSLNGVVALSATDVWAVGNAGNLNLIERYNPCN